jgi:hypothetical protein
MSNLEILKDIPDLQIKRGGIDSGRGIYIENNVLFISTWYASCNYRYFSSGCSISTLFNYFKNEMKRVIGKDVINKPIHEYLPVIDFNYINPETKSSIDNFYKDNKRIVLICDNTPFSGQAYNVDFNSFIPIIKRNTDIMFVTTNNRIQMSSQNLVDFSHLTKTTGVTLNEISYLSEKCETLIGCCSGPHTFCWTQNNILNTNKKFITFVNLSEYDFGIRHMGVDTCKVYNFSPGGKEEIIENIIRN